MPLLLASIDSSALTTRTNDVTRAIESFLQKPRAHKASANSAKTTKMIASWMVSEMQRVQRRNAPSARSDRAATAAKIERTTKIARAAAAQPPSKGTSSQTWSITDTETLAQARGAGAQILQWRNEYWKVQQVWICAVGAGHHAAVYQVAPGTFGYISRHGQLRFTGDWHIQSVQYSARHDRVFAMTTDGRAVLLDAKLVWPAITAADAADAADPYDRYFTTLVGADTGMRRRDNTPILFQDRNAAFSYQALYDSVQTPLAKHIFICLYEKIVYKLGAVMLKC